MKLTILFLLATILTLNGQDWQPDTIHVDSRATYLRTNSDAASGAVPFALDSAGLQPGDWVYMKRLGDFDNGPNGDTFINMIGVFSSNDTLLANTIVQRVPGAVDAGVDFVTANTWYSSLPTDIAEDFFIDSIYIQIPDSARFLFLSASDSWFQDNSDPDGDFALRIIQTDPPRPILIQSIPDTVIKEDSGNLILIADIRSNFAAPIINDTLSFSIISSLPQVNVFLDSFELHLEADSNFFGAAHIELKAQTGYGTFSTDTFSVNILPVNDAPYISGLADTIYTDSDSLVSLTMQDYAFDVDTPDSLLQWDFKVSSEAMIINFDSINALLQLHITESWDYASIICTVTDDSLAAASDTIFFRFLPVTRLSNESTYKIKSTSLSPNYPNPFNPLTHIGFSLQRSTFVTLKIYNMLGQEIASLVSANLQAGNYSYSWDARSFSSGIYYYTLSTSDGFIQTRKLILLK